MNSEMVRESSASFHFRESEKRRSAARLEDAPPSENAGKDASASEGRQAPSAKTTEGKREGVRSSLARSRTRRTAGDVASPGGAIITPPNGTTVFPIIPLRARPPALSSSSRRTKSSMPASRRRHAATTPACARLDSLYLWIAFVATTLFGVVGFADDYIKVVKKRSLGLTGKQKLFGQLMVAIGVWATLYFVANNYPWNLSIPFFKSTALKQYPTLSMTWIGPSDLPGLYHFRPFGFVERGES